MTALARRREPLVLAPVVSFALIPAGYAAGPESVRAPLAALA